MAEVGVSQQELAKTLGMSRSLLNAYLNGYQTPPVGLDAFVKRALAALDRLEQAEQAADRARQKVLRRPVKELGGAA